MSSETQPALDKLLASAPFQRCRHEAARTANDPTALTSLLDRVAAHEFGIGQLPDTRGGIDIDIACAVVDAHIAELNAGDGTSAIADARCRLVIAALHYLVDKNDVIPDDLPEGHVDDVAVLRWATHVARGEAPAE
ncbi:hypothetical protein GCM10011492_16460 [Flexivirga endophytica]|uniref:DUF1232 domain-containing protein n=1 Tax=Flexivirga endophytica TaxID=1849103 RepID=A0A916T1K1_9MICO|nr:DUF1232 domain-containing protein [Flexivirga endophytica]GGB26885.1 hypothetical protein GCM10011492_16460 [Flexivirga endophytica]GHB55353.1 hypothetical protein GCM10008112_25770 [Flexivirga endophytica]